MWSDFIYEFFDNATAASVVAVFVGAYIAKNAYKEQRKIDLTENNKKDILKDFEVLNGKVKNILSIFSQIGAVTKYIKQKDYAAIKVNSGEEVDREKRLKDAQKTVDLLKSLEGKYPQIATILYQNLPELIEGVNNKITIYFHNSEEVKGSYKVYEKELLKWVDLVKANFFNDELLKSMTQEEAVDIRPVSAAFEKLIKAISRQ